VVTFARQFEGLATHSDDSVDRLSSESHRALTSPSQRMEPRGHNISALGLPTPAVLASNNQFAEIVEVEDIAAGMRRLPRPDMWR
jgi:hypothetical protein